MTKALPRQRIALKPERRSAAAPWFQSGFTCSGGHALPRSALAALLALAACNATPPAQYASLPADAILGAGDPLRSAVASTSVAFSAPQLLAGHPAEAAQAVAQMEYLAVQLPNNPRYPGLSPTLGAQLEQARQEWRRALAIPASQPPQAVIDSLYAASRALRAGRQDAAAEALPAAIFPEGGQATLLRLASLPGLPLTNDAAVAATDALRRTDGLDIRHR